MSLERDSCGREACLRSCVVELDNFVDEALDVEENETW